MGYMGNDYTLFDFQGYTEDIDSFRAALTFEGIETSGGGELLTVKCTSHEQEVTMWSIKENIPVAWVD